MFARPTLRMTSMKRMCYVPKIAVRAELVECAVAGMANQAK
jgi:hypothetical protein